jgi:hypothetical protein
MLYDFRDLLIYRPFYQEHKDSINIGITGKVTGQSVQFTRLTITAL